MPRERSKRIKVKRKKRRENKAETRKALKTIGQRMTKKN